jgi:hypothetical protein
MSAWITYILVFFVGLAAGLFVAPKIGRAPRQQDSGQVLKRLIRDSQGFFDELRNDLNRPEFLNVREFAIVESSENTFVSEDLRFVYYEEDFPELKSVADELDKLDFVDDVTTGKTPIYRVRERLVMALRDL